MASKYLDRHATYVALSRHRESAEIYWSRDEFPDFKSVQSTLSRERLKDTSLDYALARGIHHDTLPAIDTEINRNMTINTEMTSELTTKINTDRAEVIQRPEKKLTLDVLNAPLPPETKARYDALLHQAAREYNEQQMDEFFQKRRDFKTLTRDPPQEKALIASLSSVSIEKLNKRRKAKTNG